MTGMRGYLSRHVLLVTVIILCVCGLAVHTLITTHINLSPWCSIKIEVDMLSGDRASVRQALKYLQTSDPGAYQIACAYVDTIVEKYCLVGDPHIDPSTWTSRPQGCYVRGSRNIYIAPAAYKPITTIERANLLARYAGYSKAFWEEQQPVPVQ